MKAKQWKKLTLGVFVFDLNTHQRYTEVNWKSYAAGQNGINGDAFCFYSIVVCMMMIWFSEETSSLNSGKALQVLTIHHLIERFKLPELLSFTAHPNIAALTFDIKLAVRIHVEMIVTYR